MPQQGSACGTVVARQLPHRSLSLLLRSAMVFVPRVMVPSSTLTRAPQRVSRSRLMMHGFWMLVSQNSCASSWSPAWTHSDFFPLVPAFSPVTVIRRVLVRDHATAKGPGVTGRTPGCTREMGITESFGAAIYTLNATHLTDGVIYRSKRMMLDTLGVGLLGTKTAVFNKVLQYSQRHFSDQETGVWGRSAITLPSQYAAFVNGVAVHSMDFDDTWHPATHPSGAVLPALLALAEAMPSQPSGLDLLLAFNVGIEVQGRLLRFSKEAYDIPKRFHPPTVVGVMGSAAASAKLLRLSPSQCIHALAIAASSAGSPLASAGTQTKPLHIGNAARRGLESAQLAWMGLEGNPDILDLDSGFGVFYTDYGPSAMADSATAGFRWLLEDQAVATKRFPAHLGMHWVVDAALTARRKLENEVGSFDAGQISRVLLRVPPTKYINCPIPATEHQARHSFQFNACSALLDNQVTVGSFHEAQIQRPALKELLSKVEVESPEDNHPSFDRMYCEVVIKTKQGQSYAARCNTFYGHWRKPLSHTDLVGKFRANASAALSSEGVEGVLDVIKDMETTRDCSRLFSYLKMTSEPKE
ncbi:cis-aconitate decarboxylase [Lampris incognitus]|uniref:cis-aconitate decarboxylase n=1 Tax=Lampris incognitus TaxID=2546036 RepID=UPI0024B499ED|nr:cis-aconitate decarboxylase [Lampris incognitus]